eukprot:Nk52_evm7s1916 gene=Nk52_evmTU7s1916
MADVIRLEEEFEIIPYTPSVGLEGSDGCGFVVELEGDGERGDGEELGQVGEGLRRIDGIVGWEKNRIQALRKVFMERWQASENDIQVIVDAVRLASRLSIELAQRRGLYNEVSLRVKGKIDAINKLHSDWEEKKRRTIQEERDANLAVIRELRIGIMKAIEKKNSLKETNAKVEQETKQCRSECEKLDAEWKLLNDKYSTERVKTFEHQNIHSRRKNTFDTLTVKLQQTRTRLKQVRDAHFQQREKFQKDQFQVRSKCRKADLEIKRALKENEELEKTTRTKECDRNLAEEELVNARNLLQDFSDIKADRLVKMNLLKEEVKESSAERKRLEKINRNIQGDAAMAKEDFEKVEDEELKKIEKISNQIQQTLNEKSGLHRVLASKQNAITECKQKIEAREDVKKTVQQDLDRKMKILSQHTAECDLLLSHQDKLLAETEKERQSMTKQREKLSVKVKKLQGQLKKEETHSEDIKENIKKEDDSFAKFKADTNSRIEQVNKRKKQNAEEKENLRNALTEVEKENESLEKKKCERGELLEKSAAIKKERQENIVQERARFERLAVEHRGKLIPQRKKIEEINEEISKLKGSIANHEIQSKAFVKSKKENEEGIETLKEETDILTKRNLVEKKKKVALQAKMEELLAHVAGVNAKNAEIVAGLEATLDKTNMKMLFLTESQAQLKEYLEAHDMELAHLKKKLISCISTRMDLEQKAKDEGERLEVEIKMGDEGRKGNAYIMQKADEWALQMTLQGAILAEDAQNIQDQYATILEEHMGGQHDDVLNEACEICQNAVKKK